VTDGDVVDVEIQFGGEVGGFGVGHCNSRAASAAIARASFRVARRARRCGGASAAARASTWRTVGGAMHTSKQAMHHSCVPNL
jgi:hypothetical protein